LKIIKVGAISLFREYVTPSESIGRLAKEIGSNMGGAENIHITLEGKQSGEDIYLAIKEVERRRGRSY
jgi:hypothetical protein